MLTLALLLLLLIRCTEKGDFHVNLLIESKIKFALSFRRCAATLEIYS